MRIIASRSNVSSLVTFVTPELALFSSFVSLYNTIHIPLEDRERREAFVSSLNTITSGPVGLRVCEFLLEYGATTSLELESILLRPRLAIYNVMQRLQVCGVVEVSGYVGPPYRPRGQQGRRTAIYGLAGVIPEAVVNAQKRYGEARLSISTPETVHQCSLDEAVALVKTEMLNWEMKRVPDKSVIMPLIVAKGIKGVTYDMLITRLHKEGVKL